MLERIKKEVPETPGCYVYYDKNNEIIYIGKAKNLRRRMTSYFNRVHNIKTTKLVSEIVDFKFYMTNTDRESLILENRLIKQYKPKYNIMLKDDKTYPYILVTDEEHPRILKVRDRKLRGTYYGPYPSNSFVNNVMRYINRTTQLRKCRTLPKEECIYYHLKQCYAPCIKFSDKETIKAYKEDVKRLLGGSMGVLKSRLNGEINKAVKALDFEAAAKYRDLIIGIDEYKVNQAIEVKSTKAIDVIGFYYDSSNLAIAIVNIKNGGVVNIDLSLNSYFGNVNEAIISTLYQYYQDKTAESFICEDKAVSELIKNVLLIEQVSDHLTDYQELEAIAKNNAREYFKNNVEKLTKMTFTKENAGFEQLKQITQDDLRFIEMYDISHLGGDAQVAGKVVFENGKKNPKLYRKYKIKTAKANDEYGSMQEVLDRRLKRIVSGEEDAPNLIVLDGGKGQVSVVKELLNMYNLDIKLMGLVKDDKHRTRAIVNKNMQELPLAGKKDLYKFLYELQEEVHRYAIDFHHKSRTNEMFMSELTKIEGLGPKRRKLLIDNFKTIEQIKIAKIDEIINIGIPKNVAERIIDFYKIREK